MINQARSKTRWSEAFVALLPAQFRPFVVGAECTQDQLVVVVSSQSAAARLKSYRPQLLALAGKLSQPAPNALVVRISVKLTVDLRGLAPPALRMPQGDALIALQDYAGALADSPLKDVLLRLFAAQK